MVSEVAKSACPFAPRICTIYQDFTDYLNSKDVPLDALETRFLPTKRARGLLAVLYPLSYAVFAEGVATLDVTRVSK